MDIRELRVNNLVYFGFLDDHRVIVKIDGIRANVVNPYEIDARYKTEDKIYYTLDGEQRKNQSYLFVPIPITEEILINAGFISNDLGKYNPDDEYAEQFKYTLKSGIFYRDFECSPYKGWYVTIGDEKDNIKFEYLHQLQNIIFDLTGKELEIKF